MQPLTPPQPKVIDAYRASNHRLPLKLDGGQQSYL
jgi:hypothetical protein